MVETRVSLAECGFYKFLDSPGWCSFICELWQKDESSDRDMHYWYRHKAVTLNLTDIPFLRANESVGLQKLHKRKHEKGISSYMIHIPSIGSIFNRFHFRCVHVGATFLGVRHFTISRLGVKRS